MKTLFENQNLNHNQAWDAWTRLGQPNGKVTQEKQDWFCVGCLDVTVELRIVAFVMFTPSNHMQWPYTWWDLNFFQFPAPLPEGWAKSAHKLIPGQCLNGHTLQTLEGRATGMEDINWMSTICLRSMVGPLLATHQNPLDNLWSYILKYFIDDIRYEPENLNIFEWYLNFMVFETTRHIIWLYIMGYLKPLGI